MAKSQKKQEQVYCPYCDEEIRSANLPWCQACHVSILYCPKCRKPLSRGSRVCPHCGADIKDEASKGS